MASWIIDTENDLALFYENAAGVRFMCGMIAPGTDDIVIIRWVIHNGQWAPGDKIVIVAEGIEIPLGSGAVA